MNDREAFRRVALTSFFIGIAAGVFGGLVGVGGGVIMVPLLTAVARLSQHEAHAASLAGVVATGLGGAITYARGGAVDLHVALILASVAVIATYAAARYSARIPALRLRAYFGAFLIFAAFLLLAKDELLMLRASQGAWSIGFLVATGMFVGVSSGLLGIGGGALMVPLLAIGLGMGQHVAQGTSLAAMVPSGASGTIAHARNRNLRGDAVLGLVPGIILGSWAGGHIALSMSSGNLRAVFSIVLVLLGIQYLNQVRRARKRQMP